VVHSDTEATMGRDLELVKKGCHGHPSSGDQVPIHPRRGLVVATHGEAGQGPIVSVSETSRALELRVSQRPAVVTGVGRRREERGRRADDGARGRDGER
jgi:hypothetical protein